MHYNYYVHHDLVYLYCPIANHVMYTVIYFPRTLLCEFTGAT